MTTFSSFPSIFVPLVGLVFPAIAIASLSLKRKEVHQNENLINRLIQHENFVINDSLSLSGSELKEKWLRQQTSILFVLWIPI
ncbi:hypothetical protein GQ457_15G021110 [Hibiscus cannabinus]